MPAVLRPRRAITARDVLHGEHFYEKYFASPIAGQTTRSNHPDLHQEGAYRDRHDRGLQDAVGAS